MHRKQKKVILFVIITVALMLLFPPWLYFDPNTSNQQSAGYSFFLLPPAITSTEEMFGIPSEKMQTTEFIRVKLNVLRLITQITVVAFFALGLIQLHNEERTPQAIGCAVVSIGGGVFATLILILLATSRY